MSPLREAGADGDTNGNAAPSPISTKTPHKNGNHRRCDDQRWARDDRSVDFKAAGVFIGAVILDRSLRTADLIEATIEVRAAVCRADAVAVVATLVGIVTDPAASATAIGAAGLTGAVGDAFAFVAGVTGLVVVAVAVGGALDTRRAVAD